MSLDTIKVNLPSEMATLKTVVMCFANPVNVTSIFQYKGVDVALFYQLWHNKINPFFDHDKVCSQQQKFMDILNSNGVRVLLADQIPGCGTQHYTRDIGFAIDNVFFVANPRRHNRKQELGGIHDLLSKFSKVAHIDNGAIEGGDVIVDDNYIIIGLGEETNKEGIDCLKNKMQQSGIDREIITLEFAHRGVIHLDTKFNIPIKGVGLIHPKSFKSKSLKWLENQFDLIEATDEEMKNIEINTFSISPKKVVMQKRSSRLASLLEKKGVEVIFVDYSEVLKLPGAFRCTTLPIERI
ncbi:MAG: N-dimethylarginine dimethylaminohydrolase [Gammaproteobacteria bacterium]|nr:N-dimethylarginine dimethylaminohydrolase [Gammaproteobacteria bacterium]